MKMIFIIIYLFNLIDSLFASEVSPLWVYFIDGRFHKYGPKVFDEGRHNGGRAEPGYMKSVLKAHNYISARPLTVETYQEVHRLAISHFNKNTPDTYIEAKDGGRFRSGDVVEASFFPTEIFYYLLDALDAIKPFIQFDGFTFSYENIPFYDLKHDEILKNHHTKVVVYMLIRLSNFIANDEVTLVDGKYHRNNKPLDIIYSHELIFDIFTFMYEKRVDYINEKLNERIELLNKVGFCDFYFDRGGIVADYIALNTEELTGKIIDNFNASKKTKRDIFRLYQELEWLHPFYDGQGRTDIIVLQKLLVDNGYEMIEMYDPYLSTYLTVDELLEIY